eukprot:m.100164 g.100164  ORF g.100164 m.100164 type:complete len:775 (-) comp15615_c1_seq5:332-2656(-)
MAERGPASPGTAATALTASSAPRHQRTSSQDEDVSPGNGSITNSSTSSNGVKVYKTTANAFPAKAENSSSNSNTGSGSVRSRKSSSANAVSTSTSTNTNTSSTNSNNATNTNSNISTVQSFELKALRTLKVPVGLHNLGNTCYASSALQALCCAPPFLCVFSDNCFVQPITAAEPVLSSSSATDSSAGAAASATATPNSKPSATAAAVANSPPSATSNTINSSSNNSSNSQALVSVLSSLIRQMLTSPRADIVPSEFVTHIRRTYPAFRSLQQQDADEFLRFLLDKLHEQTAPPAPIGRSNNNSISHSNSNSTRGVMGKIFSGEVENIVVCRACKAVSKRSEHLWDLLVEIPNPEPSSASIISTVSSYLNPAWLFGWGELWSEAVSLQDCLRMYFAVESMSGDNMYKCDRCASLQDADKYLRLKKLPEVLCITLKRFKHEGYRTVKNNRPVNFPLEGLSLTPFLSEELAGEEADYELVSVVNHTGSLNSGHYSCYGRSQPTNKWFWFDDEFVSEAEPRDVASVQAYVLIYRRVSKAFTERSQQICRIVKEQSTDSPVLLISKQWMTLCLTTTSPGPLDNSAFVCEHGGLRPFVANVPDLAVTVPLEVYQYVVGLFGGGPTLLSAAPCMSCQTHAKQLAKRRLNEQKAVRKLQSVEPERAQLYAISSDWIAQWHAFVSAPPESTTPPPSAITNEHIVDAQGHLVPTTKPGEPYIVIRPSVWQYFTATYGGGPAVAVTPAVTSSDDESQASPSPSPDRRKVARKRRSVTSGDPVSD